MSELPDSDDEVIDVEAAESDLAARLRAHRPVPSANFRGALGRHLAQRDIGYGPRPPQLGVVVTGCLAGGGILMALGALQAVVGF